MLGCNFLQLFNNFLVKALETIVNSANLVIEGRELVLTLLAEVGNSCRRLLDEVFICLLYEVETEVSFAFLCLKSVLQ